MDLFKITRNLSRVIFVASLILLVVTFISLYKGATFNSLYFAIPIILLALVNILLIKRAYKKLEEERDEFRSKLK